MDRRQFLRNTLLGALAAGALPRLAWSAADGGRTGSFAAGLAREPWLIGWQNAARAVFEPTVAKLEGRIPAALAGVLYRNGPALFERAGYRYKHWFDGDGMLHAWQVADGQVRHRARMVATPKFQREDAAQRFLLPAAGSTVPDAISVRNNDDMNTANTAVIEHAGRVYALWEGGSATEVDPADLITRGPVNFRDDLIAAPFSAHPLIDRDGSMWNIGGLAMLGAGGVLVWRIGADGKLLQSQVVSDEGTGYVHSFCMTERHLVVMLEPYSHGDAGKSLFERMQYDPAVPCRVAVIPKDALDQPRWFEVEHAAVYHWADAVEHAGIIDARAVRHHDLEQARAPMAAAMRGERERAGSSTELVSLRIDLGRGTAEWVGRGHRGGEFPVFDARSERSTRGRIYMPVSSGRSDAPYSNAIVAVDAERGVIGTHRYGKRVMSEEHRFVPRPGSSRVDDGWLVGTVLDFENKRTGLSILDARKLDDGPIAMAWLPFALPLGFHGWWSGGG